jgi:hypothetical protein
VTRSAKTLDARSPLLRAAVETPDALRPRTVLGDALQVTDLVP